ALSLSPRCTATAVWSDARGVKRTVFEDQGKFYPGPSQPAPSAHDGTYKRDYIKTAGYCRPIEGMASPWAEALGSAPAHVSYTYDPLQQLTAVDSPLAGPGRARIAVRFDMLGRTLEVQEKNSGCTRYAYDGLNSLISETGFRYESDVDKACGASQKVRNEKS